jgi:hypothetical protein
MDHAAHCKNSQSEKSDDSVDYIWLLIAHKHGLRLVSTTGFRTKLKKQ